jgi:hypothetical protein
MKNGTIFYLKTGVKFSKAADANPDPDPRIRTHKQSFKTQNAYNSGSKHDMDPRIGLKVMRMDPELDSQIWIQEFLCGPRFVRYGSPPPDPIELQTIFMCEGYNLMHLVDTKYHILNFHGK